MSDNTLRIGSVLHGPKRDYTVKSVLGQGGFGITYLVEGKVRVDNILVDAKFAVKEFFISSLCWRDDTQRLTYSKSQSDIINRSLRAFVREADRLKSLNINHPNLLNINEVFEANGTAYYVMEYLNGGSLAQYIKQRGRLSWDEVVALCKPIVDAVALLHTNQVAHYDIKPQNIMLVQDGNALRPVLIDFGLAKHYDAQGNATSTGLSGGYTPGYAPVEQYHGIANFQPTADVYALAATIYHCLTGHAPAAAEVLDLDAVCDELLNLNVSAEAVNILLQALDLRPTKRPATAAALLTQLFAGAQLPKARHPRTAPSGATEPQSKREEPKPAEALRETVRREPVRPEPVPEKPVKQRWWTKRWLKITGIAVACVAFIVVAFAFGDDIMWSIKTSCISPGENNLKLQVTDSYGSKLYYSQNQWNNLTESQRNSYTKQGVVIDYAGERFVVKLEMERHGSGYEYDGPTWFTWDEAKQWVSNRGNGWRLPTKDEGHAMADQYEAVCKALRTFGCDDDPATWYWTSAEYDSSRAWYFFLNHGVVYANLKSDLGRVRAVRAI